MTTLTAFVTYYKKALLLFGIFVLLLAALLIFFNLLRTVRNTFVGSSKASASVAFGKLPKVDFAEGVKAASDTVYKIETISGDVASIKTFAKVFSIKGEVAAFSDLENAKEKARALDFEEEPLESVNGSLKFVDSKGENKILTVETVSQAFRLDSNYLGDPRIISTRVRSEENAKRSVINFFEQLQIPIDNFPEDKMTIETYKVEGGKIVKSLSLSDANLVKVIFNRADVDSFPVFYINSQTPLVWALTTGSEVVAAEYDAKLLDKHKFSTYPLKTAKEAFEDLKNGKGVLNKEQNGNVIAIRSVNLGYLETKASQPYLQPVYVFESDDGLVAFVDAVDKVWIN